MPLATYVEGAVSISPRTHPSILFSLSLSLSCADAHNEDVDGLEVDDGVAGNWCVA